MILAAAIPLGSLLLSLGILLLAYRISFWLWFVLHTFWSYQILAARCLEQESRKVYRFLAAGDLSGARTQLSYLVGRETSQLSAEEVTKACVETVAENTSDGVTAPLFYLLLGGVPLGFCYKAINTLDSMVGYRNAKYLFFGRASAKTDDAANWLPARICGVLTVSAFLLRLDGKNAWRIFRRDRRNHLSPNSAQTESAAAGALGIQLGGHIYFGDVVEKPTIGDAVRLAEPEDIRRTNGMMFAASGLSLLGFGLLRFAAVLLFR
ncbi:MAG: adenosylcobinamide-phosphate synthase CbiB [Ruminococcus callidus]